MEKPAIVAKPGEGSDVSCDNVAARRKYSNERKSIDDDVLALPSGALPKTSSGKLQRARTRELYETGELMGRLPSRDANRLDMVKHAAASQLSYLKLAVLGARKRKDG